MDPLNRSFSILDRQPYPLLFASLSGSHLYGFPSVDSDYDIRGAHIVPLDEYVSLRPLRETVECAKYFEDGYEDEIVTHDVLKYFRLLLKNNGYVLEQIFSPMEIEHWHPWLDELRAIAKTCITSNHHLHYAGFGYGEWTKFVKEPKKPVKRILYVFRVFMTGIHLMQTGEVESNILRLNESFQFSFVPELIELKKSGEVNELPEGRQLGFFTKEYAKLEERLKKAAEKSSLPKEPKGRESLDDLLIRLRKEF